RHGVEQVRLAEPGAPVDEEGVVRLRRRFRDRERSRVREAIRRPDHERVERVLRLEAAALRPRREGSDHGKDTGMLRPIVRGRTVLAGQAELEGMALARYVAHRRVEEAAEMSVDPVARKLVGNGENERLTVALETLDAAEPLAVRSGVQCLSE